MIIGLLDPSLFLKRDSNTVQQELDLVVRICRDHKVTLVPFPEYWNDLWSVLGRPLEQQLPPEAKGSVVALRNLGERAKHTEVPTLGAHAGKVWRRGFSELFASLGDSWEESMMRAVLRALSAGHDVIMLTRKVLGRNVRRHAGSDSTLDEITRWMLYVQPKEMGPRSILCVHHPRNLRERWTVRFDWRLPASSDGGPYPFCPPDGWWRGQTQAHRTICSKPAWIDQCGNGWARPNIQGGAGYHWDVFITKPQLQQRVGLAQINVVQFGAPAREGKPGTIHHVPSEKEGKITGLGWAC